MRSQEARALDAAKVVGERLRECRQIADLSLADAAVGLAFTNPDQLVALELGQASPDLAMVLAMAHLYGTTTDYLVGLATDGDRDPASAVLLHITARLTTDIQRLTRTTAEVNVDAVRKLLPGPSQSRRLATLVLDAGAAFATLRALNPDFDEHAKGGARAVAAFEAATAAANAVIEQCARAQRTARVRELRHAAIGGPQQILDFCPALLALAMVTE